MTIHIAPWLVWTLISGLYLVVGYFCGGAAALYTMDAPGWWVPYFRLFAFFFWPLWLLWLFVIAIVGLLWDLVTQ